MAARVYFYAESLARTTTTTTTYGTVKVSLTFQPSASKTYAIFFSVLIDSTAIYPDTAKSRLRNTTSSTTLYECDETFQDVTPTSSRRADGGVVLHTDAGGAAAQTVEIQIAAGVATTTVGASGASIFVLELIDSVDIWSASASDLTASTQVYQTKNTLSWTPVSVGDYLVFHSATVGNSPNNSAAYVRLTTDGVITNPHEDHTFYLASSYSGYVGGAVLSAAFGAKTSTLEVRAMDSPGSTTIRQAYGVALRLDEFENYFTDYDAESHGTTSTSFADAATVTGTSEGSPYFILGYAQASNSAADFANAVAIKANENGFDIEANTAHIRAYLNGSLSWLLVRKRDEITTSTTWKTMYARTAGSASGSSAYNAIAALQLEVGVATTTMAIPPDAIAASTNLSGAVTLIQDDPDSHDGNWITATSATSATDIRVTFPTPIANPYSAQNFRYLLRKTAGTATPTITAELRQSNTLRRTLSAAGTEVTSTSGVVIQGNWAASDLVTTLTGADVELRIISVPGLGPGALPAYNSTGQAAADTSATITSAIAPANPSTIDAGDLLILQVLARNDNSDGAGPGAIAGWTAFEGNPYGGANNARTSVYWRIAGAGEASQTVSVTCTGGTTADLAMARIYRFTAADGFAANPVSAIASLAGTTATLAAPTVTPTSTNQLAVCLGSMASSDATIGSMTGETGGNWTEVANAATTTGGDGTLNVQTSDQSAGGAISGGTIGYTVSTSSHWVTVGFVLVPANAGAAINTVEVGAIEWNATHVTSEGYGPIRISPDAIAASTNLSGAVSDIQDYPNAADANWLTATAAADATDVRVTFPKPLVAPDGTQYFKILVRKTTGSTTPSLNIELRQANVLRKVISRDLPVTSTSGEIFDAAWHDTDLVTTTDGSDVELRLYSRSGYSNFDTGSSAVYSSTGNLLVSSAFLTYNEVFYPETVASGDLLVCQAVTRNLYMDSGASMSDPGWTALAGNPYGTSSTMVHQSLFWRIADGTEGGTTAIVRTYGNNVASMALVCIHRFVSANGFASASPIENIGVDVGCSPTVTVSRTITPSSINQLAVCAIGIGENVPTIGSLTGATGATWTQRFVTGSSLESICLQTADVSSGTPITGGEKTFSVDNSYWSALTFCVLPAPVGLTAVNTVEIGAIEWECTIMPSVSSSYTIASATFV